MRHAILMTAYKQPELINRWIDNYAHLFDFYIHIDLKSSVKPNDIHVKDNVYILKKYKVNWGGVNHLKAFIELMQLADLEGYDYYHTISAQDWMLPFRLDTLEKGKSYMEWGKLPRPEWKKEHGGFDRIRYYCLYDYWNYKSKPQKYFIKYMFYIQKGLGIRRKKFPMPLYGGSGYMSLTQEAVTYILSFIRANPMILKRFEHTFCAEELIFQTLLMNSPLKDKIINNPLRYMVWPGPKVLDESDYEKIKQTDSLFIRKIDSNISDKLLKRLENESQSR